ncbi:MAG: DNA repair protein RecN [Alphaproteobacteria bacterium]|nr:DNA repair protein RecN [Alphaproteobacteria bacterium]
MLVALSIRDIVLIDRLDLTFEAGLGVLTGETGAGKSILLDALGLALGARSDSTLVRPGADQAVVSAVFQTAPDHPIHALLAEQGHDPIDDGDLVLRRILGQDGRSRAFLNDQPVGVGLLRTIGGLLVEIQGQHDQQGLLNPATHRVVLDAFGALQNELHDVEGCFARWRAAEQVVQEAREAAARAAADEDLLRHAAAELVQLAPEPGEVARLEQERALLANAEKLVEALSAAGEALTGETGAEPAIARAQRALDRAPEAAAGNLAPIAQALDRAGVELAEAGAELSRLVSALDSDPGRLEELEDRLFALREVARKHGVGVDQLTELADALQARLSDLDDAESRLQTLAEAAHERRSAYCAAAERLTAARRRAAAALDQAVAQELPPLKLDRAHFVTRVTPQDEANWGPAGTDRVAFEVSTIPDAPPGPIARIASGGELSRFMLALKVVLAGAAPVPTLIFDEVDSGIGGATADAVGERLARLAGRVQVLVVTHSPQVAARGGHHWQVRKDDAGQAIATNVVKLDAGARREEIARMLSGAEVTAEARAAADRLLGAA